MLRLLETMFRNIFFGNTTHRDLQVPAKNMQRGASEGSAGARSGLLQRGAVTDGWQARGDIPSAPAGSPWHLLRDSRKARTEMTKH